MFAGATARATYTWLVYTLPLAGFIVGASYHYLGRGLERGSNLLIEEIHRQSEWIPLRLTPLACTLLGLELFGGNSIALFALVCAAAYATSGHTGIYHAQRVSAPKTLR